VVIDTQPSAQLDASLVAGLSDLILVLTRPAILDLRAILGTINVIKGAARRALIVLNACPPPVGAGEATLTGDARRAVAAFGMPVAPGAIVNRVTFSSVLLTGLTAGEAEPDGKAAREVRALCRAVEKELIHEKAHARDRAGEEDTASTRAPAATGSEARGRRRQMTTSLRIQPELLAELKLLALQKRVRVNDVILEAIRNHLAMHGRHAA
jgi:hypothetical protein